MVENREEEPPTGLPQSPGASTIWRQPYKQEIQQEAKLQEAPFQQGNSNENSSPAYIEVTYLNKICLVFLPAQGTASSAARLASLPINSQVIKHFSVNLELIQDTYLIHIPSRRMLDHDEHPLPYQSYFLAFKRGKQSRKPYRRHMSSIFTRGSSQSGTSGSFPLLSKRLFKRQGRSYIVKQTTECEDGLIQELHLHQAKGNPYGFVCPVLSCGAHFKKSCDLVIHFHVETGCKPYKCSHCKQAFRRNILLKKHFARDKCPVLKLQRLNQIQSSRAPTRHHSAPTGSNALLPQKSLLTYRPSPDPPSRSELKPLDMHPTLKSSPLACMVLTAQLKQLVASRCSVQRLDRLSLLELISRLRSPLNPWEIFKARLGVCQQIMATHRLLSTA